MWESRVASVKAIRYQAPQIRDTLNHLANLGKPHNTKSEAESLATYEIENFEFLLGMIIWHNILFAVNSVSKIFQKEDIHIDVAIIQLKVLITFLEKYRETGFLDAIIEATEVATLMEIDLVFREKRVIRKKKQFDENVSEEVIETAEEYFRVNYFMYIIDHALSSLKSRFEQFQVYEENFGFLFDLKKLSSTNKECLKTYCVNLEDFLKHDELSDIDGRDLFSELNVLKEVLPKGIKRPIEVLNYLKTMDGCFSNAWIVYRILLTIPVTMASGERSFLKLKLIKSYLRSTMSQERLNVLALLSIEKDMVDKFDYPSFISDFGSIVN
ncbi:zinc finger MYM-type protein 1-like [Camellia sinensis]|uniref:zinc finger MYM-type protein 1-like n=1 Tax=Camellia sinensis TaxID=4442 RepID=UPI00103698A0|nr:zinc finger MYM-type protein 1-like [Camellia sinensis]